MCEKLAKRKQREIDAVQGKHREDTPPVKPGTKIVSDKELLAKMGIKVRKKDAD